MLTPPERMTEHMAIWGIAIHPDFQGLGLGKRLIELIEEYVKKKGIKKLHASYFEPNINAKRLYVDKLNYEIEGRQKFATKLKDGTYADIILIDKILDQQ
ncbi:MAG: GNAT family N-acetyltransferase [Candidatus Lokiarchaeota archaeon]|nr:GNAT family N-acetyltransferase [Candidatus Lokiarchaeota archaeon]